MTQLDAASAQYEATSALPGVELATRAAGEIRVGFAQLLSAGESADDVIARADSELIRTPRNRGDPGARPGDSPALTTPAGSAKRLG